MAETAARRKPVQIGCPHYRRLVRGNYECDEAGRFRLGPGGEFLLHLARCGQHGGRCPQTLCALHRHNRRARGSWYPTGIWAMRQPPRARSAEPAASTPDAWYG